MSETLLADCARMLPRYEWTPDYDDSDVFRTAVADRFGHNPGVVFARKQDDGSWLYSSYDDISYTSDKRCLVDVLRPLEIGMKWWDERIRDFVDPIVQSDSSSDSGSIS